MGTSASRVGPREEVEGAVDPYCLSIRKSLKVVSPSPSKSYVELVSGTDCPPLDIITIYVPPKEKGYPGKLKYKLPEEGRVRIPISELEKERKKEMWSGYQEIHVMKGSETLFVWRDYKSFQGKAGKVVTTLRMEGGKLVESTAHIVGRETEIRESGTAANVVEEQTPPNAGIISDGVVENGSSIC